jgi:hypothetical protein
MLVEDAGTLLTGLGYLHSVFDVFHLHQETALSAFDSCRTSRFPNPWRPTVVFISFSRNWANNVWRRWKAETNEGQAWPAMLAKNRGVAVAKQGYLMRTRLPIATRHM